MKAIDRVDGNTLELPKSTIKDKSIFLKDGSKLVRIQFEDVLFIKSEGNYANFVQEQSQTMNLVSMKELEDKLPPDFIRVHRSYIVNRKNSSDPTGWIDY